MNATSTTNDFSRFQRRLILRGTLLVETGLRLGTGQSDEVSGADIAVVKDAQRRPFIPGSSFKGALRAHIERIVRTLWTGDTARGACDPLNDKQRCVTSQDIEAWQRAMRERPAEPSQNQAWAMTSNILSQSCRVCRVFGSPWLASKVSVKDIALSQPELWTERRYEVRAGVGIERDSEAAQAAVLYNSQLVSPGTDFSWEIVIENADPITEEPLVFIGLREMMKGHIPLGGGRSRGLGRITLAVTENDSEVVTRETLADYLITGKGQAVRWEELETKIGECVKTLSSGK